jgi:hypothetical protein
MQTQHVTLPVFTCYFFAICSICIVEIYNYTYLNVLLPLHHIQEVVSVNFGPEACCTDMFHGLSQSF